MAAQVGSIFVNLNSNTAEFVAGMKRSGDSVARFGRRSTASLGAFDRALGSAGAAIRAFAATTVIASVFSLAGALTKTKDALSDFDRIAKDARAAGIGTDLFQGLQLGATEASVNVQNFTAQLINFNRRMGNAESGFGAFLESMKRINPTIAKQATLLNNQEDRIRLIADAIKNAKNESEAAAIAYSAFGDSGAKFVEIFRNGGAALDDFTKRLRSSGGLIDKKTLADAERLETELGNLSFTIDRKLNRALVDLAPAIKSSLELFGAFASGVSSVSDGIKILSGSVFGSGLSKEVEQAKEVAERYKLVRDIILKLRRDLDDFSSQRDAAGFLGRGDIVKTAEANIGRIKRRLEEYGEEFRELSPNIDAATRVLEEFARKQEVASGATRGLTSALAGQNQAFQQFIAAGNEAGFSSQERALASVIKQYSALKDSILSANIAGTQQKKLIAQLNRSLQQQARALSGVAAAQDNIDRRDFNFGGSTITVSGPARGGDRESDSGINVGRLIEGLGEKERTAIEQAAREANQGFENVKAGTDNVRTGTDNTTDAVHGVSGGVARSNDVLRSINKNIGRIGSGRSGSGKSGKSSDDDPFFSPFNFDAHGLDLESLGSFRVLDFEALRNAPQPPSKSGGGSSGGSTPAIYDGTLPTVSLDDSDIANAGGNTLNQTFVIQPQNDLSPRQFAEETAAIANYGSGRV